MGLFQIHPQPRPPERPATEWSEQVWSDAGGRVARRPVRVLHRFPRHDSPGRNFRDGIILLVFTLAGTPIMLGLGVWALIGPNDLNDYIGAAFALTFLGWWWYISIKHLVIGGRGAGRRTVRGVTVGRTVRTFHGVESGDPCRSVRVTISTLATWP